jgi:uncharacterized integral membrane protein
MSPLEPVTATSIACRPPLWPLGATVVVTANNALHHTIPDGRDIQANVRARFLLLTNEVIVSDAKQGPAGADEGRTGSGFQPLQTQGRRIDLGVLAAIVAAAAMLIFILQNTDEEEVTWLFFDASAPLWVVIVVTAVLSVALSQFVLFVWRRRRRRHERER